MDERVALITGGNRGLGLASASKLAAKGFHVVVTARKPADGEAAVRRIGAAVPGSDAQFLVLDLASFASIRGCADAFHELGLPLHLLVENAGFMSYADRPAFTVEGFESCFGVNHLGHFLLTHLLLDDLVASAPSRVVVVSSAMHRRGVGPGPGPDFDYGNLRAEKSFDPSVAYRNSKLANLWFAAELDRRLRAEGVTVVSVSPGWVPQTQVDHVTGFQRFLFQNVLGHLPFARTVEEGSDNTVFAATAPGVTSGGFYEDGAPGVRSDEARSAEKARRLWEASVAWCRLQRGGAAAAA
jgi:NAD(P)-dependent dehydrogenase (short-subunit alcohol dehydrogenase family)